jgi:hypothetical protein
MIELSHFLIAFMQNGQFDTVRILDSTTVDMMFTIQHPDIADDQGLIWYQMDIDGRLVWLHAGGDWGVLTCIAYYPEEGSGVMVLTNGSALNDESKWGVYLITDALFDCAAVISTCEYVAGDCNHNGTPLELGDVVAMIGMYRGTTDAEYTCPCPPHGDDFAPEADPNGNCVAFELGDVVTEIGAYRGTDEASGCPDCPGSLRLIPEGSDQPFLMPSMKSEAKDGGNRRVE